MNVDRIRQALLDLKAYGVGGNLCDYDINEQDVIDVIDGLRKANEWQTIDSAPKDGTRVLTCWKGVDYQINRFNDPETTTMPLGLKGWWCSPPNQQPTHWMPLPPPPSTPERPE